MHFCSISPICSITEGSTNFSISKIGAIIDAFLSIKAPKSKFKNSSTVNVFTKKDKLPLVKLNFISSLEIFSA